VLMLKQKDEGRRRCRMAGVETSAVAAAGGLGMEDGDGSGTSDQ